MTRRIARATTVIVAVLVLLGGAWLSMNRVPAQTPTAAAGALQVSLSQQFFGCQQAPQPF